MPITNYPGGASSFGIPLFGQGSIYDMPCGRAWFVCNRSGVTNGDGTSRDRPLTSIADAIVQIATTNATLNDFVFVLAGHAENVTGSNIFSASLVNTTAVTIPAGTRIIAEGEGSQRAALTFTAAGSTIALAAAGCTLENFNLLCPQTGTTTVAAMVTVTARACQVIGCNMQLSSSATALCTTGISLSSAAAEFYTSDNLVWGLTGTPTSWLSTTGTTGPNRVYAVRNNVRLPLSAANSGVIDTTANSGTAAADWVVGDNNFANTTAASTVVVKLATGHSGFAYRNFLETVNGAAATAITGGAMTMFGNLVAQGGKQAIAITLGGAST